MDVLVIESSPGIATTLQHRLTRDGHEVISCNDSHGGPCRGVESNESCPMAKHIDVAVLARERDAEPSLNEMGSVVRAATPCAAGDPLSRRRVRSRARAPRSPQRSPAARSRPATWQPCAATCATASTTSRATREFQRVHVTITVDKAMSAQTIGRLADRARQAVREHDAHTPVVDISVVRAAPASARTSPYQRVRESVRCH